MRHLTRNSGLSTRTRFLTMTSAAALIAASVTIAVPAVADDAAAQKWIDSEFQPSTLSKADQLKEMQWFAKAAELYAAIQPIRLQAGWQIVGWVVSDRRQPELAA